MIHRIAMRLVLVLALLGSYFLTLHSCAGTEFFAKNLGTIDSPLFPWIQYLWWLPFGIGVFLLVRQHLSKRASVRSFVFALIFAPGVLGIYSVTWLVPAFSAILTAFLLPTPAMLVWIAKFSGVPFLVLWLLSYSVIRFTRFAQDRGWRRQGSRTRR